MTSKEYTFFTIGHSTHSIDELIGLLEQHGVNAVCDVRSSPYSQFNPQFNRESLQKELKARGIAYAFLGAELGARVEDPTCYIDGKLQFDRVAATDRFKQGLDRLRRGIRKFRVSLLCAEKDPIMCHRMILICRQMRGDDVTIQHILEDGTLERNEETERRMMNFLKIEETNLFMSNEELVQMAYERQGRRITRVEKDETAHA